MPQDSLRNLDRVKEMKVKVPARIHLRLHSMKILTGKGISDAVVDALEAYLAAHEDELPSLQDLP